MEQIMTAIADSSSEPLPPKGSSKSETPNPKPRTVGNGTQNSKPAKKTDRSDNPNPKSKELRGQSNSSSAKKNTFPRNGKPSFGGYGNRAGGKSGRK
jgi:hypothetical protein